jgi:hypothetical protein
MPTPRPPQDPGRPTPREAIAKATAAAGPKVAKAVEAAGPRVEKAATTAGKLLGTLAERARDTAKQFNQAYSGDEPQHDGDATPDPASDATTAAAKPRRPRPRPTKG